MSSTASTTINPVCFTCALPDKCCVFSTTVCVPTPLREELTIDELIDSDPFAQILDVMCRHGFLWNPCSGPSGAHNVGFTFTGLLTELQQTFPDHGWEADDLELLLATGIQRGLFKRRITDDTFYANQNLLNVNPKNWIYEDVCSQLCAKKACVKPHTLGC